MRALLFVGVALVYLLISVQALLQPSRVMQLLGIRFDNVNGLSEFHAIYVGVWWATAAMLIYAGFVPKEQVLAHFAALLVLAQPIGRTVGLVRKAVPVGNLRLMFGLELLGGVLLWLLA